MANIRDEMRAWVRTATKDVRFGPDREAAGQELLAHIEDKSADLMRIFPGMDEPEAMQRAMDGMGDPAEISRALAKVHKPWLGYLWQASRLLLLGAVCALAVSLISFVRHNGPLDWLEDWRKERLEDREGQVIARVLYEGAPVESLEPFEAEREYTWDGVECLGRYDIHETKRLGEADVTLSRAALWRMEAGNALYAEMTVAYDRARDSRPLLGWYLQAEDSLGNHYGYEMTYRESGAHMSGFGSFGWQIHQDGYTWNFCLKDLPEEAQWVRFTYALRPASGFEFVIDLTGEVEP